jgi:hypothetical protein
LSKQSDDEPALLRRNVTSQKGTTEAALNYSLTEIFNFESRTYTCLSRNLASKAEALVVQPFSAVDEGDLLDRAFYALLHRGGSADHAPRSFKKSGLIPKNLKS